MVHGIQEREGFRKVFRKVSEVFRMVPVSSRSVLEGSRRLRKFLEGLEGSGISLKVPEGSHVGCTTPHGLSSSRNRRGLPPI